MPVLHFGQFIVVSQNYRRCVCSSGVQSRQLNPVTATFGISTNVHLKPYLNSLTRLHPVIFATSRGTHGSKVARVCTTFSQRSRVATVKS